MFWIGNPSSFQKSSSHHDRSAVVTWERSSSQLFHNHLHLATASVAKLSFTKVLHISSPPSTAQQCIRWSNNRICYCVGDVWRFVRYLHNKVWVVLSCPEALEEWWSSIHAGECAPSCSKRFSNGERKPVEERQERKNKFRHMLSLQKQTFQSVNGHPPTSDCLKPILTRSESTRLCGCQMIITDWGN